MSVEMIRSVAGWSIILNYSLLIIWFLFFSLAHDWIYRLHHRWFNINLELFDTVHYLSMAIYKTGIFLFNLVPYLALLIIA